MNLSDRAERNRLAMIACSQLGVREEGGNNCGPKVREYQAATWLEPAAWPWCAAFVDWCVREWSLGVEGDPLFGKEKREGWRPKTAGAQDLLNWANLKGMRIVKHLDLAEAGDIAVFGEFSHCGIVVQNALPSQDYVRTVEGNTGPAGLRDAESGDGVFMKKRARSLLRAFIRMERV